MNILWQFQIFVYVKCRCIFLNKSVCTGIVTIVAIWFSNPHLEDSPIKSMSFPKTDETTHDSTVLGVTSCANGEVGHGVVLWSHWQSRAFEGWRLDGGGTTYIYIYIYIYICAVLYKYIDTWPCLKMRHSLNSYGILKDVCGLSLGDTALYVHVLVIFLENLFNRENMPTHGKLQEDIEVTFVCIRYSLYTSRSLLSY